MRLIELFCGAGGMSHGFTSAGMNLIRAYDNWDIALAIHEANVKKSIIERLNGARKTKQANIGRFEEEFADQGDILSLAPAIARLQPDIIVGGPPCQPWSSSGPRKGSLDPRAKLTDAFLIIIAVARPKYFVMENVPDLEKSEVFQGLATIFRRAGYGLTIKVLDASYYGVGQKRRRLIVAGCLGENDQWLLAHLEAAASKRPTTVADVLGADFGRLYFRKGHSERRSLSSTDEPAPTITSTARRTGGRKGYTLRPADGDLLNRVDDITGEATEQLFWLMPGGKSGAGTRSVDQPAPTITHGVRARPTDSYVRKTGDVIDIESLPIPTFEELSRIGGFPKGWDWSAAKTEGDRMQALANAVPPPLAESIGRCILAHAGGERPKPDFDVPKGFITWLTRRKKVSPQRRTQIVSEFRYVQRLLAYRVLDDVAAALAALERDPTFQSLSSTRKSNLRRAIRLYAECDEERGKRGEPPLAETQVTSPGRPRLPGLRRRRVLT